MEHLAYQWPGRSRIVVHAEVPNVNVISGHKTQRRIKAIADVYGSQIDVQQIVGVIDSETVGGFIALQILTIIEQSPNADQKILVLLEA